MGKELKLDEQMVQDTLQSLSLAILDAKFAIDQAFHQIGKNGKLLTRASAQTAHQKARDRMLQLQLVRELLQNTKMPVLSANAQKALARLLFPKERSI